MRFLIVHKNKKVIFLTVDRQYLREFLYVFIIYTVSFYFVDYFVMPIQKIYLPTVSEHCCLLFIPHAIRVFSIWLYGFRGLMYMLISAQFSYYVIYDNHPLTYLHFLSPFVAPIVTFACFEFCKNFGPDPYNIRNWKVLIFVGVLSSLVNGFILGLIFGLNENAFINAMLYTLGDFNGVVVILILMLAYLKIERKLS